MIHSVSFLTAGYVGAL